MVCAMMACDVLENTSVERVGKNHQGLARPGHVVGEVA
jgi:hypothetical protein